MFQASFLLAFFGLLRVSEFTVDSRSGVCDRVIHVQDVIVCHGAESSHMLVTIRFSKTDQYGASTTLRIKGNNLVGSCPVEAMARYLEVRPLTHGPIFCHANGSPLTRYQFSSVLRKVLSFVGLEAAEYGTHSFRIGAATSAAIKGVSEEKIQEMGRWRSGAFKTYVRP